MGRFLASRQGFVIGLMLYLLAYGAWLMRLREFYDFYFLVLFAPLALLCGYGIGEMWSGVATLIRKGVIVPAVRSVILMIVVGVGYGGVKTSQLEEFPKERAKDYAWFDATSLGPVNSLYRAAVWKDRRELNRGYIGATYYLWHEMRHIEELDGVAEYVRAHSEPTDTVFGESGLAPLVAFLADRELAGHVADTNTKRFSSGQTSVAALLGKIDNPRLRFVFGSKRGGRYQYVNRMLTKWLDGNFAVVHEFRSALKPGTTWMVLERN